MAFGVRGGAMAGERYGKLVVLLDGASASGNSRKPGTGETGQPENRGQNTNSSHHSPTVRPGVPWKLVYCPDFEETKERSRSLVTASSPHHHPQPRRDRQHRHNAPMQPQQQHPAH